MLHSVELILIDIIRYFAGGFFSFYISNNSKKSIIKKSVFPALIYTLVLAFLKIFIMDNPYITLVSATMIFTYLLFENKFQNWNFLLTYSMFVSCLTEYAHFLIFKAVSKVRDILNIPEFTPGIIDKKLIISRLMVVLLYVLVLFLVYKFKSVNLKAVQKLSEYKSTTAFLVFGLGMIIYLKFHIKYTSSDEFHNILSIVFVFFAIMFFTLIIASKKLINTMNEIQKNKTNPAIEEAKLQKGKYKSGMKFISENLSSEMKYFQDELSKIGIDELDLGGLQTAFAAVLLNHEENPQNVPLRSKIYTPISEIFKVTPGTIEGNISNILKRHWGSYDSEILEKIKNNYKRTVSEKNGAPTPKEFLIYLVKNFQETRTSIKK